MFQSSAAPIPVRDRLAAGTLTAAVLGLGVFALRLEPRVAPPSGPVDLPPLVELIALVPPPAGGGGAGAPRPPRRSAPRSSAPPRPPPRTARPPAAPPAGPVPAAEASADPVVADLSEVDAPPAEPGNGRGTGTGPGDGPGSGEGPPGPTTGSRGAGGGPVALPWSAVRVRRVVEPTYPRAASDLGLPSTRCRARVSIDARGRPTAVDVEGCSTVFHAETVRALRQWRFAPARVDGRAVPATFVVPLRFTPQAGG